MLTLAITLQPRQPPVGHTHNITHTMHNDIFKHWRTLALKRRPHEHVHITITDSGIPLGRWTADHTWPRETIDVIRTARQRHQGAPA